MPELVQLEALALSRAIRSRAVSCREVMQAYLAHIEAVNPQVNAIVSLQDGERLLAQADERDRQLARGEYLGWLHGIPQAIKDLSPSAGIRTTLGSPLFRDHVPEQDGTMVSRIRREGAIFIGKTNTPEFGLGSQTYNTVFGATRNAYDHGRTAGGSSGGAAVALAMRMLPVADGSDMMGSLRNPAAFNNVFGFRPSFGRVPYGPAPDVFGQQLATEGPMGRSVADVARLLATQAGPDPRAPLAIAEDPAVFAGKLFRDFSGARIGWLGDWQGYLPMETGVLSLCEQALQHFGELGCEVEPLVPEFDPASLWQCWLTLRHWAVAGNLGELYADPGKRALLKPEARWEVEGGLALSALDVHKANLIRSAWYQSLRLLFERYDFLVLPTAQVFPFEVTEPWPKHIQGTVMDSYHRWMEVVIPGTLSGCPVANLPAGFNAAGLPMGLQVIGPHQADLAVLQLAHAYEQTAGDWLKRLPGGLAVS
ncbi:amidase [Zobellella aerophila]|uniref:Amidase n=1 Tax=Zobellella aerophila TaxID=870480 RepID=A0ABP6VZW8_9GAMM